MIDDFDTRTLCPDGACIGVLDARGVCKVCGKKGSLSAATAAVIEDEVAAAPAPVEAARSGSNDEDRAEATDDDDDRELCSDGGCIGLIGPNGRCKVCNKPRA